MRLWFLGVLPAVVGGCTPSGDVVGPTSTSLDTPFSDVSAALSEAVPTVLHTSFVLDGCGTTWIRYGYDGVLDRTTPPQADTCGAVAMDVIGLKAGSTAEWQPVVERDSGDVAHGPVGEVEVPSPPSGLEPLRLDVFDATATESEPFHVLTHVVSGDDSFVVIIDRDGDYVWIARSRNPTVNIVSTEVSMDGRSVLWTEFDRLETSGFGGLYRMSLDGREEVFTAMPGGHHDVAELGDGTVAYLAFDLRESEVEGLGPGLFGVQGTEIRVVSEGTTSSGPYQTVFSTFDDYHAPPWLVCSHMEPEANPFGLYQWDHANSLLTDPATGELVVLWRNFDAVSWIDPISGAITREVGGLYGTPFAAPGQGFDHGHMSQITDEGFVVFDNGLHGTDPSALVEFAWEPDGVTAREVFRYEDPEGAVMPVLSDADRLPNGNYLGTWTAHGRLTEVTPEGVVVWQVETTDGGILARATPLGDLNPDVPEP